MKVVKPLPALLLASVVVLSILCGAPVPAVAQRNDDFARQQQEQQRRQQQDEQRRQQQEEQRRQQQEEQRRQRQEEQRRQQDEQRRQQQEDMRRQQQDQMRQQQRDQARQQQDDLRRQQQADMRRQTQDEQRRAMQQEQKNQQRQQTQQAQKDQQREQQKQATQAQMRDQQKGQQTKAQQQQDTKQLQQAQKDQLAGRAPKAGTSASVISRTTDRMVFSNGVAKLTRPLTADEAKRGFTGKVTADGRPLVAFQNRVFAVPAARAGFTPPKTSTSQAALASRWTPQKQNAVKNDIQKLAGVGAVGKAGPTAKFDSTATRNGDVVKVSSPQIQSRIDTARAARKSVGMNDSAANMPHAFAAAATGNGIIHLPYAENSRAREIILQSPKSFVRVHGDDNKARSWIMRAEDVKGLTAQQIKDKFAIPELPKYISDVDVPAGTRLRVGKVREHDVWGEGGATQFELKDRLSNENFKNTRRLQ